MTTNDTPRRAAIIHATYRGMPVDLTLDGAALDQVEKLVEGLLRKEGWAPAVAPALHPKDARIAAALVKRPQVDPVFQPDGTACCPWHLRPLKEGRYGMFCPTRCDDGDDHAGPKGYCSFSYRPE